MHKKPSNDSFPSTLVIQVLTTHISHMSAQLLHPQHQDVYIIPVEENEHKPVPLALKKVLDWTYKSFNSLAYIYISQWEDSNEASEKLVVWKAGYLCQYELYVDNITGFIFSAENNTQTTLSDITAMLMACVKPIAFNYVMFENPCAMHAVKTVLIHSWWYEEIARVHTTQTCPDSACIYISVENKLSQWFFSLLSFSIRLF